jgi:hypothetical protein
MEQRETNEAFTWKDLAKDYVFNNRTDYIRTFVKTIHKTKVKNEQDFKYQLDMMVL